MKNARPLILISNDDGYHAKGLRSLLEMIADMGRLLVCAPEAARSGFSRAFTVTLPLTLKRRRSVGGAQIWSCGGTPVDCVKIALAELCPRRPDLIIGGINHGDNASVNAHYSGTMGVALEGCMKYIPSVAFSLTDHSSDADFTPMRALVRRVTADILSYGLPLGSCLNVNFPAGGEVKGVRICRMARASWVNETVKRHHPRGYDYWWMTGSYRNDEPDQEDTDNWALTHGYAAVTPTTVDMTDYKLLDRLKKRWQKT